MRARHDHQSVPAPSTKDSRPANRAERRAAARGRDAAAARAGSASGRPVPPTAGPGVQVKPLHTRTDYAARRSG